MMIYEGSNFLDAFDIKRRPFNSPPHARSIDNNPACLASAKCKSIRSNEGLLQARHPSATSDWMEYSQYLAVILPMFDAIPWASYRLQSIHP